MSTNTTTETNALTGLVDALEQINPSDKSILSLRLGDLNRNAGILAVSAVTSALSGVDANFETLVNAINQNRLSINDNILSITTLIENNEQLGDDVKFLLNTRDIANQMIVTEVSTWYYDANEVLHAYSTLGEALTINQDFSGKINYAADMVLTGSALDLSSRNLVIDLNGHSISCERPGLIIVQQGSNITIQNGTIYAPKITNDTTTNEYKFQVYRGKILLKNVYLDLDGSNNASVWKYRVFNLGQKMDEMLVEVGHSEVEFDKDCVVRFHDCNLGEAFVCSLSPYSLVSSAYQILSSDSDFLAKYPTSSDYAVALRPVVTVDGDFRITHSDDNQSNNYPSFNAGTGLDWLETVINVEKHARIFAQGHALYLGNNGIINLNGGYIVGRTGICMRSGTLNVPRDANPTVVGIGEPLQVEYSEVTGYYDPYHSMRSESDAGDNLHLGHAVLLESNALIYGRHATSANIQSGTFISYNNTAIGSYGIALRHLNAAYRAKDADGNYLSSTFNGNTVYFCQRPTLFASGIQISRREAQSEYNYFNGSNPDYATALTSTEPQLNAVKFERGHTANLTTEDGLKQAVKDLLILLGDKEEDITI